MRGVLIYDYRRRRRRRRRSCGRGASRSVHRGGPGVRGPRPAHRNTARRRTGSTDAGALRSVVRAPPRPSERTTRPWRYHRRRTLHRGLHVRPARTCHFQEFLVRPARRCPKIISRARNIIVFIIIVTTTRAFYGFFFFFHFPHPTRKSIDLSNREFYYRLIGTKTKSCFFPTFREYRFYVLFYNNSIGRIFRTFFRFSIMLYAFYNDLYDFKSLRTTIPVGTRF